MQCLIKPGAIDDMGVSKSGHSEKKDQPRPGVVIK